MSTNPVRIFVDADACPVKSEVERVATRHQIQTYIVSNGGIRPSPNPLFKLVVVSSQSAVSYTHLTLPTICSV